MKQSVGTSKACAKKARSGELRNTEIDSPYEVPVSLEIKLSTTEMDVEQSAQAVIKWLQQNNYN